jgi:hypothetical protein
MKFNSVDTVWPKIKIKDVVTKLFLHEKN